MPIASLSDITLRHLKKPGKGQVTYWDKSLKGFGVRVSQGGSKSYVVVYGETRKRVTLGKVGILSLSDARTEAKRILAEHTLGKARPDRITFSEAQNRFLSDVTARLKESTVSDYKWTLERHFKFRDTQLTDITQKEVLARLSRYTPAVQNHAFVVIRAFFNWCVKHRYIDSNPLQGLSKPHKSKSRDRVLTDEELLLVYEHAQKHPYPFGPIVQLLILTLQRRNEISTLKWSYIDTDTVTLPDTKGNRPHVFPISQSAQDVIANLPKLGEYLFPARGNPERTYNGWSKGKRAFDKGLDIEPWTLHDLRRTGASKLAALGTPIHVTEKLLNHTTGTLGGIVGVYNRHTYLDEMRGAVESLAATLGAPA